MSISGPPALYRLQTSEYYSHTALQPSLLLATQSIIRFHRASKDRRTRKDSEQRPMRCCAWQLVYELPVFKREVGVRLQRFILFSYVCVLLGFLGGPGLLVGAVSPGL